MSRWLAKCQHPRASQSLLGSRGASSLGPNWIASAVDLSLWQDDRLTAVGSAGLVYHAQFSRQAFSRFALPNYRCAVASEWPSDVIGDVVQPVSPRRRQGCLTGVGRRCGQPWTGRSINQRRVSAASGGRWCTTTPSGCGDCLPAAVSRLYLLKCIDHAAKHSQCSLLLRHCVIAQQCWRSTWSIEILSVRPTITLQYRIETA